MFYKRVEAAVVTGQAQWFMVEGGLRQGSVLSPLLYYIFMMDLVNELEDSGDGVRVEEDMAMVAESEEGMGRGAAMWESMGLPGVIFAVEVSLKGTKAQQKRLDAV